jgi:uncharacterized protein YqgC (DUF456 family)
MENIGLYTLQIIVLAVMIGGLLSLLLAIIPGLTIIWVAALVYLIATGLNWTSGIIFAIITILMLVGNIIDNFFMGASARQTGASWVAIAVSMTAGIVGSILWPPLGGLLAALAGLFIVEIIRLRDWQKALNSTRSMAMGCGWALATRFGIGIVMILLWVLWVFLS